MENRTLGEKIAAMRKARGMTQLELAREMGVTDKAVSKWERDLACPDVHSLPKLAEILGVTMDALMQDGLAPQAQEASVGTGRDAAALKRLVFRGVALAMGVALFVLAWLKQLDLYSGFQMAGIAIASLSLNAFAAEDEQKKGVR